MKRRLFLFISVLCIVLILSSFLPKNMHKRSTGTNYKSDNYFLQNISNITAWTKKNGSYGSAPNGDAGVIYPAGSSAVIFTAGLIWGGYVHDPNPDWPNYRFGGQAYKVSTVGGRILSTGNAMDPEDASVRVYRIRKDWQTLKPNNPQLKAEAIMIVEQGLATDTSGLTQKIIEQYQKDWQEWPAAYGAPFYDVNKNGLYEPELGETPGLAGADQVLWLVVNDLDENKTRKFCACPPIGLEIQQTIWGYDQPRLPLGQISFQRWRMINKSGFKIDSMYAGMFVDPDIGKYADDLIGCDSVLHTGFAYNAFAEDNLFDPFGLYPPAIGYQLLQGPITHSAGGNALFDFKYKRNYKNLSLKAFSYFGIDDFFQEVPLGEYTYGIGLYQLLRGFKVSKYLTVEKPFIHKSGPDKGKSTKFPLSGDPLLQIGDLDNTGDNWEPGDRRFIMGSGPFEMAPGDTQEVVYTLIGGLGNALYPYCVEELKLNARYIQDMYPKINGLNDPFPQPKVNALSSKNIVTLEWGSDAALLEEIEQNQQDGIYRFEGYNIYQLPSQYVSDDQAVLIESIDLEDGPGGVFGYKRDPLTGIFSYKLLVNGSNSGIRHYTTIERDYFTNQPFQPGQSYTFAVSAYRYIPKADNPFPIIESKLTRINVLIHEFNPGYSAQTGQEIEVQHSGPSTGYAKAIVANPANVTGHTYEISFDEQQHWALTDLNTNEVKLINQKNISGDENAPVVDGILPIVFGPVESGKIKMRSYSFRIRGNDWGGQIFNHGIGLGQNFFGSTVPADSLVPVKIVFEEKYELENYGYSSRGASYLNNAQRSYNGTGNLPLEAFEICSRDSLRKLNICFYENPGSADNIWDMGWNGSAFPDTLGANEYLLIMKSDYDEGAHYNEEHNGTNADVLYALWLRQRDEYPFLSGYNYIKILVDIKNTPNDYYLFTTPSAANLPESFELLPAYPNPFNGSVRFHFRIPVQAVVKIDIYDLNGRHVKQVFNSILEQGTHLIPWQAKDIASGMYFYKVSFSGKFKLGKMLYIK